jgi:hypothetical protein
MLKRRRQVQSAAVLAAASASERRTGRRARQEGKRGAAPLQPRRGVMKMARRT